MEEFSTNQSTAENTENVQEVQQTPPVIPEYSAEPLAEPIIEGVTDIAHENPALGILGAVLFSLIGIAAYFILYQLNFIAGICGFIIFSLALLGYSKLSGRKNSKKGVIIAVIVTLIAIFAAEFFCITYEIFKEFEVSFIEAIRLTFPVIVLPEILPSVIRDLLIAYGLSALASFTAIRSAFANAKKTPETYAPVIVAAEAEAPESTEAAAENDTVAH